MSLQGRTAKPPFKPNQDSFLAVPHIGSTKSLALFAVFDGHGPAGENAAHYCRVNMADVIVRQNLFV